MKRFLIGCIGVLAAASAHAQTAAPDPQTVTTEDFVLKDAGDLLELCKVQGTSEVAKEAIHFCHGFIAGTYQYHQALTPKFGRVVCPPENVTRNDGVRIFTEFLQANPQHLKGAPTEVLMQSWIAKYPCRP
ncbi:MAG: Rap1a/Tai family immunity protein [Methyloceanibacter sp.]